MTAFIRSFLAGSGGWIGSAVLVSRLSSFLLTMFAARFIVKEDFGMAVLALNFLGFFIPMTGLGNYQGMLRYGSMLEDDVQRERLATYSFTVGLWLQWVLNAAMIVLAGFIYRQQPEIVWIICLLSVRFLGIYFLEHRKAELRADFDNRKFSFLEIAHALFALALGGLLSYFLGLRGYLIALSVSPFVVLLFGLPKLNSRRPQLQINFKEFWRFSWITALTSQVSDWIFMLDILLIGIYLSDASAAQYRVSSIIPMNLLAIGYIFLQTEYPKLCKYSHDRNYQLSYIKSYWRLMFIVSVAIIALGYPAAGLLLSLFGPQYTDASVFHILLWATASSLLLRIPFGNMLASIGKSKWNLVIALFLNALVLIGLVVVLPDYGLIGAAWLSVFSLTLSGVLSAAAYFHELKYI